MAKQLLQSAIEALRIKDVYIKSSTSSLADEFEPKYYTFGDEEIATKNMHIVEQSSTLELLENEDDRGVKLFRVQIALGVQWVGRRQTDEKNPAETVLAEIEARMIAEYQVMEEVTQEALNEFAINNASFHVWPYWREYLSTQCNRMNLPRLVVPAVQFAHNRD